MWSSGNGRPASSTSDRPSTPETTCLVEPDGGRILLVDIHRQHALELTGVPHKPPPPASSMILRCEEQRLDARPGKPEEPHGYPLVRAKDPDLELGLRDLPDKREERGNVVLGQEIMRLAADGTAARCRRAYRCRWSPIVGWSCSASLLANTVGD